MRILFLSDNFPPEYNAPATRTFEHCREWVKLGAEVTVITCAPNFPQGKIYDGYKNRWKQTEYIDGIKVIRVWSFISANQGTLKRSLDFLSYALTSFLAGLTVKCDLIVATSPQFFTAVSGCALGILRRKRWVMEVRDIWPESIKAVDAVSSNWVISALEKVELFLYRRAYKIVVVTDSFKVNLTSRGIASEKIFVVKNGVDLSMYQPRPRDEKLLAKLGIRGKVMIGYIGTHGLAHSLDFIVRSIARLQGQDLHFIFIGDGAEKQNIMRIARELNLTNITFNDPVKKTEIPAYLSILDIALVPLRRSDTFESVIPSKMFETVAMNIPILLGVNGESRGIIEHYGAGVFFEPENEADFIEKTLLLSGRLKKGDTTHVAGCQQMANDFDRKALAQEMLNIISN